MADQLTTLRPNADDLGTFPTISLAGNPQLYEAGAYSYTWGDLYKVLNGTATVAPGAATWIYATSSQQPYTTAGGVVLDDISLATGARIDYVQTRLDLEFDVFTGGSPVVRSTLYSGSSGQLNIQNATVDQDSATHTWTSPAQYRVPWSGQDWTAADVNNLGWRGEFATFPGGLAGTPMFIFKMYLDVYYRRLGVVTPSATTNTIHPVVSWSTSAPDSPVPQERYRVKVFSSAQYGAGGFNPWTSIPTWDSLEIVDTSTNAVTVPVGLQNGTTYRAYVWTAQQWTGTQGLWWNVAADGAYGGLGTPAYYQWTCNPGALLTSPGITLTANPNGGSVGVNITTPSGGPYIPIVERSVGGGAYIPWRFSGLYSQSGSSSSTYADHEAPLNQTITYRVQIQTTTNNSAYVTAATFLSGKYSWLKEPTFNYVSSPMNIKAETPFAPKLSEPQGVFPTLGRSHPIITGDGTKGWSGSLIIRTESLTEYNQLMAFVTSGKTLLLQTPDGKAWYIRIGDGTTWETIRSIPVAGDTGPVRDLHRVTIPWNEVDTP